MITIYKATKDKTTAEFLTEAEALAFSDNVVTVQKEIASPEEIAAAEAARTLKNETLKNIDNLEGQITPRRLRDAVLTSDGATWLADKEAEILIERSKLTN